MSVKQGDRVRFPVLYPSGQRDEDGRMIMEDRSRNGVVRASHPPCVVVQSNVPLWAHDDSRPSVDVFVRHISEVTPDTTRTVAP